MPTTAVSGGSRVCRMAGVAVLTLCLLSVASVANADVGAAVLVGKIAVAEPLHAGGVYNLPPTTVMNSGDKTGDFVMRVRLLTETETTKAPDPRWFAFDPASSTLIPKQARQVEIRLTLPLDAEPGLYEVLVSNEVVVDPAKSGAKIAPAAATKVTFRVVPGSWLSGLYYRVLTLAKEWMPWSWVLPLAVVLLVALYILSRRYRVHIGVERRPSEDDEGGSQELGETDGPVDVEG